MSEWPRTRVPSDSLSRGDNDDPQQRTQQSSLPRPNEHGTQENAAVANVSSSITQRQSAGHVRSLDLPPISQAPNASTGSSTSASRVVGVSSILNPTEPDDAFGARRRKASELESPSSSQMNLPPLGTSDQRTRAASGTSITSPLHFPSPYADRAPRRILTPRSPFLHHAASLSQLNPPTAPYSAHHTPFAVSSHDRAYALEPGHAGAPPLPTPPAAVRQSYSFAAPTSLRHSPGRTSAGISRDMRPISESTSPKSSYSSYSQAGQPSPITHPAPVLMPTLSSAYPSIPDSSMRGQRSASTPMSGDSDHQRVPISSSGGHNVYQMMTLETTSGTVQLPVDVQAASRVADEKRRRNAGASARFRQRRKEKEKEASTTISRLEDQVKELSEDMDFYKRERDYFKAVVLQVPGGDRHFPRPQSPRHRRSSTMRGYQESGSRGHAAAPEHGDRSPGDGRNVRRRTSTLSLPHPPQPQRLTSAPGLSYPSAYTSQPYGHAPPPASLPPHSLPQQGPAPHAPAFASETPQAAGPPPILQAPPQTGPWNPYAERRPTGGNPQHREN